MKKQIIFTFLLLIITTIFADHVTNYDNFKIVKKRENKNSENIYLKLNLKNDIAPILANLEYNEKYDLSVKQIALTDTTEDGKINGYIIQIYKTDKFQNAKFKEQFFVKKYGEDEVNLIFEKPFYKLRIGNFLTKVDAELFQENLALEGIKNTLILPDLIDPRLLDKQNEQKNNDTENIPNNIDVKKEVKSNE